MSTIHTSLNKLNPNIPEFLKPYIDRLKVDVNIVTLSYHPGGFIFAHDIASLIKRSGKPTVCFDFEEYGWDYSWQNTSIVGEFIDHRLMYGDKSEREKLHEFFQESPIAVYFKRELSVKAYELHGSLFDPLFPLLPIELLSPTLPQPPEPNRDQYMGRNFSVFSLCGMSHPDRAALHEALEKDKDYHFIQSIDHTERWHLMRVMSEQGEYASSLNLGGAGEKCFRAAEACWNSVPIMADTGMVYRVKWDDSNAIILPTKDGRVLIDEAVEKINSCLADKEKMWERMQAAHENAKRMYAPNYMAEIQKEIESYLA